MNLVRRLCLPRVSRSVVERLKYSEYVFPEYACVIRWIKSSSTPILLLNKQVQYICDLIKMKKTPFLLVFVGVYIFASGDGFLYCKITSHPFESFAILVKLRDGIYIAKS